MYILHTMRIANKTSSSAPHVWYRTILYANFVDALIIISSRISNIVSWNWLWFGGIINAPYSHHHIWNIFWSHLSDFDWIQSHKIRLNIFFYRYSFQNQPNRCLVLLKCSLSNNVKQLSNWNEIWHLVKPLNISYATA